MEDHETGIPEEDVRLDEVLTAVGDKLFYDYDFGDDWQHTIKLEAVLPRRDSRPNGVVWLAAVTALPRTAAASTPTS